MTNIRRLRKIIAIIFGIGIIVGLGSSGYGNTDNLPSLIPNSAPFPYTCKRLLEKYSKERKKYLEEERNILKFAEFLGKRDLFFDRLCATDYILYFLPKIKEIHKDKNEEQVKEYSFSLAINILLTLKSDIDKALESSKEYVKTGKKIEFFESFPKDLKTYIDSPNFLSMQAGEIYMRLSDFYARQGNYKEAVKYFYAAKEMKHYQGNSYYNYSSETRWLVSNVLIPWAEGKKIDDEIVDEIIKNILEETESSKDRKIPSRYVKVQESLCNLAYEVYIRSTQNRNKERFKIVMQKVIELIEKQITNNLFEVYPELYSNTKWTFYNTLYEAVKFLKEKGESVDDLIEIAERVKDKMIKVADTEEQNYVNRRLQANETLDNKDFSNIRYYRKIKRLTYAYMVDIYKAAGNESKAREYNTKRLSIEIPE